MTVFWVLLLIVMVFGFFAHYYAVPGGTLTSGVPIRFNPFFVGIVMVSLIAVAGLRSNIGDTYMYKHSYVVNDFTWDYITGNKDIGFGLLQYVLKQYSADPQLLIFTTALITNGLILFVLAKYSRAFEISVFVYITGGLFLVSMNGIRQVLAAAIAFAAIKFLIEGSFWRYAIVVLIASTFHQTALILLPIYFFARLKAWSKSTWILVCGAMLIVIGFDLFSSVLFSTIEDTQYGGYSEFDEGGANVLRVIVEAMPLFVAFLGRDKLKALYPNSDVIVNMALIGSIFMMISTQNWIFARFNIYFGLYQLILLSWVVYLFRKQDQKLVYVGILICYLAYFYYENAVALRIMYESNYFMW